MSNVFLKIKDKKGGIILSPGLFYIPGKFGVLQCGN